MAKRVGVLLSGCGRLDGSDVAESILTLLVIERAGAQAICAAPDADQAAVVDHVSSERAGGARNAWAEAARLAGPQIRPLSALTVDSIDALIVPGGEGPIGFIGLSALLAARVLGPAAGVRLTLGSKGAPAAKHAAVMGADVRPCAPEDVTIDQKARVYSTPGFLAEGAQLPSVARAVDRLVRAVVANARDRAPAPPPPDDFDVTGVSTDRG